MQSQQAKHTVPTVQQSRPLFGSGIERTLPYMLSKDFVYTAEEDGKVTKIDEKAGLAFIEYKSGKTDAIDISNRVDKNGNGGYYVSNKKDMIVKEGQSFKKNEILAKNSNFFKGDKSEDITFAQGYLTKVAMHQGDYTLEDSSIISKKISEAMSTEVTMMKQIKLKKNSNVISIKNKNDHIKTGDPLIIFEHSFEDAESNNLLSNIDDDITSFVEELGKDVIKSKYTGEIVDVKIYYNVDLEECSPSLQEIITKYNKQINAIKNKASAGGNNTIIFPPTEKINSEKIKGQAFEGIIIEFYVNHLVKVNIGEKNIVFYNNIIKTPIYL